MTNTEHTVGVLLLAFAARSPSPLLAGRRGSDPLALLVLLPDLQIHPVTMVSTIWHQWEIAPNNVLTHFLPLRRPDTFSGLVETHQTSWPRSDDWQRPPPEGQPRHRRRGCWRACAETGSVECLL